jgi:photosystem II stability/assembly factor-like uncharacterized protein
MQVKYAIAATAVAFGVAGAVWTMSRPSDIPAYIPREAAGPAGSPEGAYEIHRMLLADIETGEINTAGLNALRAEVIRYNAQALGNGSRATDHYWNEMGPDNVGGRTRAIVAITENLLYAGAVSGGLWRSDDGANKWNQVHGFPNLMVGSIAVSGNGALYVGTGSQYDFAGGEGGSGFRGRGIYWSADGVNFEMIEGTDPGFLGSGDFTATDAMETDPTNPNRVWFGSDAGIGYLENGVLYENVVSGIPAGPVGDIRIAADGSYMLVGMSNARVYRSTNADFTAFESVSGNPSSSLLPQSGMGRVRVDISQDDSDHAFALFSTSAGGFGGLYHTDNGGDTWTNVWPSGIAQSTPLPRNQGIYDLALGIKKGQPDLAYVGGIEVWRSGPNQQAELAAFAFDFAGTDFDVHADIHDIIFTPAGTMYVTTDGGIYKSTDGGQTYLECNRDYSVTQFYGMDHSSRSAVLGGTQDNGSLMIPSNGYFLSDQEAIEVHGGDGFDCVISKVTDAPGWTYAWMASSQNGGLVRGTLSPGASNNYGQFWDDDIIELANDAGEIGQFYSVVSMYENTNDLNTERTVILVNPYGTTVTDSTFTLLTSNQNLPFEYTLPAGVELPYYDQIVRPDRLLTAPLTEDPEYFWLDPQVAIPQEECETDPVTGEEVCDTLYFHPGDTLNNIAGRLKVRDPYTCITATGFVGAQGVWITRDGMNFNTTPDWIRLDVAPAGGGTKEIEFTVGDHPESGNHMFVSGWDGKLYRFDGLHDIYTQEDVPANMRKQILSVGAAVTGIAVDPNDPNHVVVTIGGYGTVTSGKVQETFNALSDSPTWSNIWLTGEMGKMPCYDVVIDAMDPSGNTILIGTEYGIYASDDGGETWVPANSNMAPTADGVAAPVFDLKQQWRGSEQWVNPSNQGAIYAATHGRGIFRSDLFLGAQEATSAAAAEAVQGMKVYPNPLTGDVVRFETGLRGDFRVEIFDLSGRVVINRDIRSHAGGPIELDAARLANGTYVLRAVTGRTHQTTKLIVKR